MATAVKYTVFGQSGNCFKMHLESRGPSRIACWAGCRFLIKYEEAKKKKKMRKQKEKGWKIQLSFKHLKYAAQRYV